MVQTVTLFSLFIFQNSQLSISIWHNAWWVAGGGGGRLRGIWGRMRIFSTQAPRQSSTCFAPRLPNVLCLFSISFLKSKTKTLRLGNTNMTWYSCALHWADNIHSITKQTVQRSLTTPATTSPECTPIPN